MANPLSEELTGRHVVLREETMAPQFQGVEYRVYLVEGGFGAHAFTGGRACFGSTPIDGERFRISSDEIERLATDEEIALAKEASE